MPTSQAVNVHDLLERLSTDGAVRSRLMGLKPRSTTDLAELASKGKQACSSCTARLRTVLKTLRPDDVHMVFQIQGKVVDPKPLATPRVLTLESVEDLQGALARMVIEDEVLIRSVTPFERDGKFYAVVV